MPARISWPVSSSSNTFLPLDGAEDADELPLSDRRPSSSAAPASFEREGGDAARSKTAPGVGRDEVVAPVDMTRRWGEGEREGEGERGRERERVSQLVEGSLFVDDGKV